jgi:DHA1 family bicyclomycin/chloramphenicol resistance-like MFS transporter
MATSPKVRFLDRTTPPHIVTLVLMAGLAALAMNIFLPSLPNMTEYFDTDYRLMQLSVSLYLAMSAVLQLFIGPISDRFGRRPVVLSAIVIFLFATVGTLLASTVEVFLAFRMLQAVVVAAMVLSRAIIRDIVDGGQAASMIGYVTMGMALVPMIGPVIGGLLDEAFGWRANFLMLLISGVIVLAIVWADQGETAKNRSTSFMAQVREYPTLLKSRRFWGYVAAAAFASGAFFAILGGAPYVGTKVFGLSPSGLGLFFAPTAVGYALGSFVSGRFSVRVGVNRMVLTGALITCCGLLLQTAVYSAGFQTALVFSLFFAFVGLGNGMVLPNATSGLLSVRPNLAGTASGLGGAILIGGGAAVSALTGTVLVGGNGPYPMLFVMLATSACSVAAISYVIARERQVSGLRR